MKSGSVLYYNIIVNERNGDEIMSKAQMMELIKELSARIQIAVKYCEEGNYNKQDIINILTGDLMTDEEEENW